MLKLIKAKINLNSWHQSWITLWGALAAFGCYTSMYGFRKSFAAATFISEPDFLGLDYKVLLVIGQMLGYTASKFYGIKFISEANNKNRARNILFLVIFSWASLLGLAVIPPPFNILFMILNGFPLGMIWGLVCSYLEGRKTTEFMGAVLATTLIFASGLIKTLGRMLMEGTGIAERWMPFCMGFIFIIPLIIFIMMLEAIPPPTEEDKLLRTKRVPMNGSERLAFVRHFAPGLIATVIIYVVFTSLRDMRDNFEVEIWHGLGINNNHIFTQIDTIISLVILVLLSTLILVRNNLKAFTLIHIMVIIGCIIILAGVILFDQKLINSINWMVLIGIGLFMVYLPYNAVFFERLIATYHYKSNIGFLIYIADAFGYLASISILAVKELGNPSVQWLPFFSTCLLYGALIGLACAGFSLIYFRVKAYSTKKVSKTLNYSNTEQVFIT